MCSLCLYYKISFGQLSMYVANRLRKIQALVWTVSTITAYASVDSSLSKALVILESLLHFTGIWVEKTPFPLWGLPADPGGYTRGRWTKEQCKLYFLFSNPQVIVRWKQWMLWHTIEDALPTPFQKKTPKKLKEKEPHPPKIKINSEPHAMASTMATTP